MMPRTELIDQLIRDGVIVAYRDVRKRTLRDLANPDDAAAVVGATAIRNMRGYSEVGGVGSALSISPSAAFSSISNGTILLFGSFKWESLRVLLNVAPTFTWYLYWLAPPGNINNIRLRIGGASASFIGLPAKTFRSIAVDYGSGAFTPLLYLDGEYHSAGSTTQNATMAAATSIEVGYLLDSYLNVFEGFVATNRRLTTAEHRQAYRELCEG